MNILHSNRALALILAFTPSALPAEDGSPLQVVREFYEASRDGNVKQMRPLMAGSFLNRRISLLEHPDSYSAFLVKHYGSAVITLSTPIVDDVNEVASIGVSITHDGDNKDKFRLLLKRLESGDWVIVAQESL